MVRNSELKLQLWILICFQPFSIQIWSLDLFQYLLLPYDSQLSNTSHRMKCGVSFHSCINENVCYNGRKACYYCTRGLNERYVRTLWWCVKKMVSIKHRKFTVLMGANHVNTKMTHLLPPTSARRTLFGRPRGRCYYQSCDQPWSQIPTNVI